MTCETKRTTFCCHCRMLKISDYRETKLLWPAKNTNVQKRKIHPSFKFSKTLWALFLVQRECGKAFCTCWQNVMHKLCSIMQHNAMDLYDILFRVLVNVSMFSIPLILEFRSIWCFWNHHWFSTLLKIYFSVVSLSQSF